MFAMIIGIDKRRERIMCGFIYLMLVETLERDGQHLGSRRFVFILSSMIFDGDGRIKIIEISEINSLT